MIQDYNEVAESYGCSQMMEINPDEDLRRWSVQQTITLLANADYYYTKKEVDDIIQGIEISGGTTPEQVQRMIDESISGKADTTAVTQAISAATNDMATQTWVGEQGYITSVDLSNYATLDNVTEATSGKVETSTFETYSGDVETALSGKQDVSGMTAYSTTAATSALNNIVTAHTSDTTIHVTSNDKATWNSKSDFSGSYNDLTDKPTIPTVPTSNTAFTNDARYITSDALSGYATEQWVGEQGYITGVDLSDYATLDNVTEATSGKVDTSVYTAYTAATDAVLSGKADTTAVTEEISAATSGKVDTSTYTAYTATTDTTLGGITNTVNDKIQDLVSSDKNWVGSGVTSLDISKNGSSYTTRTYVASINNKQIMTGSDYSKANQFSLVETSDITTSITSSSTDSEVPSAKAVYDTIPTTTSAVTSGSTAVVESGAVYDQLGGMKIVSLTQNEYDNLQDKDANTIYFIK